MAWPFPHPRASQTDFQDRRLRELDRRLAVLATGGSGSGPRSWDHLLPSFLRPVYHARSDATAPAPQAGAGNAPRTAITERNGIWVVTVDGLWRGDYRKRAEAEAAAARAQSERG